MSRTDQPQAELRHLLHMFASFGLGGVPIRISEVINALPSGYRHTIVALDACFDARARLAPHVEVEFEALKLPKYCLPCSIKQLRAFVRDKRPNKLLTYNWGAIECALTNRLFGMSDHIHFESGFGADEANGQLRRRNIVRRFALGKVQKLVVPSRTLVRIAREAWHIPDRKLLHIPNGVDVARYAGEAGTREANVFADLGRYKTIIGTVAPLRPEKNVGRLLQAFAGIPARTDCALIVAGNGSELTRLRALADALHISDQTYFLGHVENVPSVLRAIDVFALSSNTEQMPNSLLQAMAAARPVAAVDVGDVCSIVSPQNRPFVVPCDDRALATALTALVCDANLRKALGQANQEHVRTHHSLEGMIAAYAALLGSR